MEYNKTCPICGKHFTVNNDQYVYCSEICKITARRKRDRDAKRRTRGAASAERAKRRAESEQARTSEATERSLQSKSDFERRVAEGETGAVMVKALEDHGNTSLEYWRAFQNDVLRRCEMVGTQPRTVVNGIDVNSPKFAENVVAMIAVFGHVRIDRK